MIFHLLLCFLALNTIHEVEMTSFELSKVDSALVVTIKVNRADIRRAWKDFERNDSAHQKAILDDYLQVKTQWKLNQRNVSICNYVYFDRGEHLIIKGYSTLEIQKIDRIDFINTFLVEELSNHLNIVHLDLNQRLRSFKMNKNRTVIKAEYD